MGVVHLLLIIVQWGLKLITYLNTLFSIIITENLLCVKLVIYFICCAFLSYFIKVDNEMH